MEKIWFTITGTKYRHGTDFMKPKMKVTLKKEPDNEYDTEAIRVEMEGFGLVGYVANSTHTRVGESWSAGRIYDMIGNTAKGKIKYVMPNGVLCELEKESLKGGKG